VLVGAAMARAAQRGYGSVRMPVEGTMLTVMRDMATHMASDLAHRDDVRLGALAGPDTQDAMLAGVLDRAIEAGEASVRRGPDLLPALREAGVVDAGGYGVIVIFAGVVAALRDGTAPEIERHSAPAGLAHAEHESATFRYCTNFAVTGEGLAPPRFIAPLETLGDSVLVVGDAKTLKVHIHTDEPDEALALFAAAGVVSHVDVADMRAQVSARRARLAANGNASAPPAMTGALAVVSGAGIAELYVSLGVHVLDGGPTLNPSTRELLAAVHDVPAQEVVILPNNANVFMAAERAAELAERQVLVVASRSQQAGLSAALALEPGRSAADNAARMQAALVGVRTGAVAPAARDDPQARFATGDAVGFVEDELVAWGEPAPTLQAVLCELGENAELVTCLAGAAAPLDARAVAGLAPEGVELEHGDGGQPSYWWLLSAE